MRFLVFCSLTLILIGTVFFLSNCRLEPDTVAFGDGAEMADLTTVAVEEQLTTLEAAASAIVTDCSATRAAWASLFPNLQSTYEFLAWNPTLTETDLARVVNAFAAIQPKVAECISESLNPSAPALATQAESSASKCKKICKNFSWDHCVVHAGACLAGDNYACCWFSMCTDSYADCVKLCKSSRACKHVNPNPKPGPS